MNTNGLDLILTNESAQITNLLFSQKECTKQKLKSMTYFSYLKGKKKVDLDKWFENCLAVSNIPTESQPLDMMEKQEQDHNPIKYNLRQKLNGFIEKRFAQKQTDQLLRMAKLQSFLQELVKQTYAQSLLPKTEEAKQQPNTIDRFKFILEQLQQIMGINPDSKVAESILEFGSVEALRIHPNFSDQILRQKFSKIVQATQSYQQLRRYLGKDIKSMKNKFSQNLEHTLCKNGLGPNLITQIKRQLVNNPLSNIVAQHPRLTASQKKMFYDSQFYQGSYVEYIKVLFYPESIHSRALAQIPILLQNIKSNCQITKKHINIIFKFNFIELLKLPIIKSFKQDLFDTVKKSCPNFYIACQRIDSKGKNQQQLKINQLKQLTLKLRRVFLQNQINFQYWQELESKLLNRKEAQIETLKLTRSQKYELRKFFYQQLQPYFHQLEKPFTYRTQVQQSLLTQIMYSRLASVKQIHEILSYIDEGIQLENDNLAGTRIQDELNNRDLKEFKQILRDNKLNQQYRRNKGIDKAQEQYNKVLKLKMLIYEINNQNQIDVPSASIQLLINVIKANNYQLPSSHEPFACDLKKLGKIIYLQKRNGLLSQFNQFLNKFYDENSIILNNKNFNFPENQLYFCEYLLVVNPFAGDKLMPQEFKLSQQEQERFKTQLLKLDKQSVKRYVEEYQKIDLKINQIDDKISSKRLPITLVRPFDPTSSIDNSPNKQKLHPPPIANLNPQISYLEKLHKSVIQQSNEICSKFLSLCKTNNQKSQIGKLADKNYKQQPEKFIKMIFEANLFENPESQLYETLTKQGILNQLSTKFLKNEIASQKIKQSGVKLAAEYKSCISKLS